MDWENIKRSEVNLTFGTSDIKNNYEILINLFQL